MSGASVRKLPANKMAYNSNAVNLTDLQMNVKVVSILPMYQTIAALLIVVVVVGFIGNFLVAVTILKNKRIYMPVYAFLMQVATLNALFQAFVVPVNIYSLFHTLWIPGAALCHVMMYATYMLLCISGLLLMLVSVYRYIFLCHNNIYLRIKDPKVVTACCVVVWVEIIVLISVFGKKAFFSSEYFTCVLEGAHLQTVLLISVYLPMTLIPVAMYIKIAIFVWNAKRRVQPQGNTSSRNYTESNKLTRTTALISLNHIVTGVLPGVLFSVISDDLTMRRTLITIAHFLYRLTAVFDVLLFIFSTRTIMSMIITMFRSLRPQVIPRDS
ncbi:hypothetical protein CHS0354_025959 [Potamilus streckersoni]|uniref:G-protein coupled receptors family 1 profile domain-containing protein n=1 Tax=Potamilus streckersoni TaxID=2493646 RepID=A0AAE0T421_9BIVA|nr:hypothetical protein CHS0354_025959 [Potamilus streckersoni]